MELSEARKYAEAQRDLFFALLENNIYLAINSFPLGVTLLNFPILGLAIKTSITNVLKRVAVLESNMVWFKFVDFRVATQYKGHTKASWDYYNALQSGDQKKIEETKQKAISAFDEFAKFTRI